MDPCEGVSFWKKKTNSEKRDIVSCWHQNFCHINSKSFKEQLKPKICSHDHDRTSFLFMTLCCCLQKLHPKRKTFDNNFSFKKVSNKI